MAERSLLMKPGLSETEGSGPGLLAMRICLTGGIASGKSTVAHMFAELGAVILDADQMARAVVRVGSPCWQRLKDFLGDAFFAADGELDRRKLRLRIIADDDSRAGVNLILHPAIMAAMEQQFQHWRQLHPHQPIIFDVPLLFEAQMAHHFDTIILAYVPAEVQIERLMVRDGVSRQEAEQSLAMQLPIEQKKQWAHKVVDNTGDLENTRQQVVSIWQELSSGLERHHREAHCT
jgi:dephospho-CoA kinase